MCHCLSRLLCLPVWLQMRPLPVFLSCKAIGRLADAKDVVHSRGRASRRPHPWPAASQSLAAPAGLCAGFAWHAAPAESCAGFAWPPTLQTPLAPKATHLRQSVVSWQVSDSAEGRPVATAVGSVVAAAVVGVAGVDSAGAAQVLQWARCTKRATLCGSHSCPPCALVGKGHQWSPLSVLAAPAGAAALACLPTPPRGFLSAWPSRFPPAVISDVSSCRFASPAQSPRSSAAPTAVSHL
eukprot:1092751-Amphidinium_carterae.1